MNKDKIEGKLKEVAGVIEEKPGKITHNKEIEENGLKEKLLVKIEYGIGKLKDNTKK